MSKFRAEQLGQPINLSGSFTGSLQGTSSFATTASYALFAANGGGGSTNTGSLLTTASVASNTITFTKGDGSTFPITVATGSGGSGTVGPGAQNYLAFFSGSTTTISSSVIYQSGSTGIGIFTAAPTYSVDVFLAGKGDNGFRLRTGTFPNPDVLYTNQKDIYIPNLIDAGIFTSPPLPLSSLNVVLSDPNDSGRLYRTASSAFGGFPFSGNAVITGSLTFAPSSSVSYAGEIVRFGAGTLVTGQLYFLSSSGTWSLANASSTGSSTGMLGLAIGSSPTANGLLIRGLAVSSSYTYGTGSIVYMATSSGVMTSVSPSASNHVVRVMGYQTTLSNTIYFDPDKTWVTLA